MSRPIIVNGRSYARKKWTFARILSSPGAAGTKRTRKAAEYPTRSGAVGSEVPALCGRSLGERSHRFVQAGKMRERFHVRLGQCLEALAVDGRLKVIR